MQARGAVSTRRTAWLMALPACLALIAINGAPLVYSTVLAFFHWNLTQAFRPPRFVGLDNFAELAGSADFWNATIHTFVLVFWTVALEALFGLAIALLLDQRLRGSSLASALLLVPIAMAPAVVGFLYANLLNESLGPINYYLTALGLPAPPWLSSPQWALPTIILVDVWQWTPFMMLLLLAGLRSLPPEIDEAARVDGAGFWSRLRFVTLPMLRPVLAIAILLRAIDAFKTFDLVYLLTFGGPGTSSQTLSFYGYLIGVQYFDVGQASAIAFVMVQVFIVFALVYFRVARERL
jgi:multiple sugar transport system permease protein